MRCRACPSRSDSPARRTYASLPKPSWCVLGHWCSKRFVEHRVDAPCHACAGPVPIDEQLECGAALERLRGTGQPDRDAAREARRHHTRTARRTCATPFEDVVRASQRGPVHSLGEWSPVCLPATRGPTDWQHASGRREKVCTKSSASAWANPIRSGVGERAFATTDTRCRTATAVSRTQYGAPSQLSPRASI